MIPRLGAHSLSVVFVFIYTIALTFALRIGGKRNTLTSPAQSSVLSQNELRPSLATYMVTPTSLYFNHKNRNYKGKHNSKLSSNNLSNVKSSQRRRSQIPLFSSSSSTTNPAKNIEQIDLLYDSECPICMMEVEFLKKRDVEGRIKFSDLSAPDYNPADHGNVKFADGMRKIRAVLPGGKVVTGVEVFRQTYKAIGLGWIFELTSVPLIGKAADAIYDIWAENRLRITGRGDLADILKERAEKLRDADPATCDTDACEMTYDD